MSTTENISVTITNLLDKVHVLVFDLYRGGHREVGGSPFHLGHGDTSPPFSLVSDDGKSGIMEYRCVGGPVVSQIDVSNGGDVEID